MPPKIYLIILMFIPAMVFWMILKIMRIKLYAYKRVKYPVEYSRFGYQTMGISYMRDIFRNPHPDDKKYSMLLRNNRNVLIITMAILGITFYIVYLYANGRFS